MAAPGIHVPNAASEDIRPYPVRYGEYRIRIRYNEYYRRKILCTMSQVESKMKYVNLGKSGLKVGMISLEPIRISNAEDGPIVLGIQDHLGLYAIWFTTIMDDIRSSRRDQPTQICL